MRQTNQSDVDPDSVSKPKVPSSRYKTMETAEFNVNKRLFPPSWHEAETEF
jgi:hypothetical protein